MHLCLSEEEVGIHVIYMLIQMIGGCCPINIMYLAMNDKSEMVFLLSLNSN